LAAIDSGIVDATSWLDFAAMIREIISLTLRRPTGDKQTREKALPNQHCAWRGEIP